MRTVTSLCMAAAAGITLAFAIFGFAVASPSRAVPVAASIISVIFVAGAMSMARRAGTPRWLPGCVLLLVTGACFGLLWSSWD